MKFVGTTKSGKIRCTRKDGETKNYLATERVVEYAKENFKKDDIVIGQFKGGKLTKLTKRQPKSDNKVGTSYRNGAYQEKMLERSAVASASTALTAIKGVTVDNYEELFKNLITLALGVINGKKEELKEEAEDALEDELDDELEDEELEDEEA